MVSKMTKISTAILSTTLLILSTNVDASNTSPLSPSSDASPDRTAESMETSTHILSATQSDANPLLSRKRSFSEFNADSSEDVLDESAPPAAKKAKTSSLRYLHFAPGFYLHFNDSKRTVIEPYVIDSEVKWKYIYNEWLHNRYPTSKPIDYSENNQIKPPVSCADSSNKQEKKKKRARSINDYAKSYDISDISLTTSAACSLKSARIKNFRRRDGKYNYLSKYEVSMLRKHVRETPLISVERLCEHAQLKGIRLDNDAADQFIKDRGRLNN